MEHKTTWKTCDVCGEILTDKTCQRGQHEANVIHKVIVGPCYQSDISYVDICNDCAQGFLRIIRECKQKKQEIKV